MIFQTIFLNKIQIADESNLNHPFLLIIPALRNPFCSGSFRFGDPTDCILLFALIYGRDSGCLTLASFRMQRSYAEYPYLSFQQVLYKWFINPQIPRVIYHISIFSCVPLDYHRLVGKILHRSPILIVYIYMYT